MTAGRNMANVVGGKTARACDNCIRKRARWFCAADDAFLCQACDASVHSANPLARRHERVRLKNASSKPSVVDSPPAWHQGITRKARTPRHGKHCVFRALKSKEQAQSRSPIVPDLGADDMSHEETEEQLLYRVPVFDPFVAELGTSAASDAAAPMATKDADSVGSKSKTGPVRDCYGHDDLVEDLNGFLPSEMDLAEFAADVESLLGRGLEHESFGMEDLGLLDCAEKRSMEGSLGGGKVQVKDEEEGEAMAGSRIYSEVDMTREPRFELGFDYDSVAAIDGEEEKKAITGGEAGDVKRNKKILLRLDYDAVMAAWAGQGSPWTGGDRPELDPNDDCWPDCMGGCGIEVHHNSTLGGMGLHGAMGNGGREARVSRYREKRRTRLFSKKIRYEVRKLNAEKRPRMKGRFVKRASATFVGSAAPFPLFTK